MAILNLPPLGHGNEFPVRPDPGKWAEADGNLKQLGRALRVNKDEAFRDPDEAIRAIPDPWAQARTFGEALLDSRHSIHRRARAQWRGLLGLFALQQFHTNDYRLDLRKLELSDDHIFSRVLMALRPEVAVQGEAGLWRSPALVMVKVSSQVAEPLALTNPICLVSPGRVSHTIRIQGAEWADGDLRDPLAHSGRGSLTAPQLVALRDWLGAVAGDLRQFEGRVAARLREQVEDYARDCAAALGDEVEFEAFVGEPTRRDIAPLFQPLTRPARIEAPDDPASVSQTLVRLRDQLDFGEKLKGIIFVDPSLAELPSIDARTCFVWGMRTLAELLRSQRLLESVRSEAAAKGYLILSADDLFTARAARLENDASIESHPFGLRDMLVPLKPVALLLEGNIRDNVTAEASPDRVTVTFTLGLLRAGGEPLSVPVTRHYASAPSGGEGLFVTKAEWGIQNVSLWPNFRSSKWSGYFARFLYSEVRKNMMARPVCALSGPLLASELSQAGASHAAITRLQALNDGALPVVAKDGQFLHSELAVGQQFEDVQFSALPFEAINYSEAAAKRTPLPAGMVLLDLPLHEPANRGTTIAVDFGTTNTVAAIQNDDEEAHPLIFSERLVIPVKYRDPDRTQSALHHARFALSGFIPPHQRSLPTATVALGRKPYPSTEKLWAFRNIIYFHSNEPYPENDERGELDRFKSLRHSARFNLKWSPDPAVAEAAADYLEQFMIMASAEVLVAGFNPRLTRWRFSVPDAFSSTEKDRFEDNLSNVIKGLSSEFVESETERALAPLFSEGYSAARYMISVAGFNSDALNMVLDIGGGTTDATIWDREKIIWRGSFRIAGQNFFTLLICRNPQILREIGLGAWANLFEAGEPMRAEIPFLAEMLFSGTASASDSDLDLQRAMDRYWDTRLNGQVGELLRITGTVFIAGIAWYLGRVVRHYGLRRLVETDPAFSLCGRGAGLFKKIHGERPPHEESPLSRALQVFDAAAGLEQHPMPEVRTTKQAKLEVVRGMLADNSPIDASLKKKKKRGEAQVSTAMISGLDIIYLDGGRLEADDPIPEIPRDSDIDLVDLAEIDAFLAELARCADLHIDLRGDHRGGARGYIVNAVRTDLEAARRDKKSKRAAEPPFIVALRALIDELSAPAKRREARLRMDFRE